MSEPRYRHVSCTEEQGALVVKITESEVQGDSLADSLRQELLDVLQQTGAKQVVLDFCQVIYLSSVAFRPLLSLRRKLYEKGGRLVFCNLAQAVGEVLFVTRLVSTSRAAPATFEVEPDLASALARLKSTAH